MLELVIVCLLFNFIDTEQEETLAFKRQHFSPVSVRKRLDSYSLVPYFKEHILYYLLTFPNILKIKMCYYTIALNT